MRQLRSAFVTDKWVAGVLVLTALAVFSSCEQQSPLAEGTWSHPQKALTLSGHSAEVNRAFFSPSGGFIVTFSNDSTTRIWDPSTGESIRVLTGHAGAVRAARILSGENRIQTYADDHQMKIWDLSSGRTIASIPVSVVGERVTQAEFSPDGTRLALGFPGQTRIYDTRTGERLFDLAPMGHPGLRVPTMDIVFRPDGARIATAAYSQEIGVWDARDGTRILNLHEHGQGATAVAYNPGMTLLASGSRDSTVIIWDARLGTIRKEIKAGWEVHSVAFSPDGHTLLVVERVPRGQARRATFWDVASWRRQATLDGFGALRAASFHPGGGRLVIPSGKFAVVYRSGLEEEVQVAKDIAVAGAAVDLVETALTDSCGTRRIVASRELALRSSGVGDAVASLTATLESGDRTLRLRAALTLADLGASAQAALPALVDHLREDPDAAVRTAAALAIGCIAAAETQPEIVPELIASLKDTDGAVRYHAAHALEKIAVKTQDILLALSETVLTDEMFGIRRMIAFDLGNGGATSLGALAALIEATTAENPRIRWWADYSIWSIAAGTGAAASDAIPALKQAMADPSDYRDENGGPPRKYAIHAMGAIGPAVLEVDPHVIPVLGDIMINDDDYYHRKAAALALENILQVKGLRQKVRGYVRQSPPP